MKLTNEQQNAVKAIGNVLVSAAAGSGKTAVLTKRVIDRVLEGDSPVDIDRLLIVTFTNAAAAEMSKRIGDAFQEKIDADKGNFRAAKQKILLESASICTIDSFCNELVKENFQQLGLNPDYSLSSEEDLLYLTQSAMDSLIDEYHKNEDSLFFDTLSFIGDKGNFFTFKGMIADIYKFIGSLPFPNEWLDNAVNLYRDFDFEKSDWTDRIIDECLDLVENGLFGVNSIIESYRDIEDIGKGLDNFIVMKADFERLKTLLENKAWNESLSLCKSFKVAKISVKSISDSSIASILKERNSEYKEIFATVKKLLCYSVDECNDAIKFCVPYAEKLVESVKRYGEILLEMKKEKNVFDFADIERFALNLLVDIDNGSIVQTELAKGISARYVDVLVDEYQDTNDLQNTIFEAISNNGGNLFTVGDVKQCIYNFRKANPKNFLKKKNDFELYNGDNSPCKIILSGNFRSSKKICSFVNFLFENLMTDQMCGMDYLDEDKLRPLGEFSEGDSDSVSIDIIDSTDSEKDDDLLQAMYIASYIKKSVESEMISDNGKLRPVEYRDFLILSRSGKDKFYKYVDVFNKAGIPISAEVDNKYFEQPEIFIILNLLRVVSNPVKDVPMLATALSPLYAVSPDEIADARLNARKKPLYTALCEMTESSNKISHMLDKIDIYRRWAASMSVSQLISKIYDDTLITHTVLSTDNGEIKKANLLFLIELAKGFEKNNFGGISAFLSYIDYIVSSKNEYTRKFTVGDSNSAQIMTVHRSKGLQAPICFIINCSKRFELSDGNRKLTLHQSGGIGLTVSDDKKRIQYSTVAREAVGICVKKDIIAEEARLLYVALTRAQNRAIMLCVKKNTEALVESAVMDDGKQLNGLGLKRSFADWLLSVAFTAVNPYSLIDKKSAFVSDGRVDFSVNVIDSNDIEEQDAEDGNLNEKVTLDYDDINARLSFKYPFENILNISSKYSASALSERENIEQYHCTKRPAFMNKGGFTASERGTLMHRFMERCDFSAASGDIEGDLSRLILNGDFTDAEAKCIDREKIAAFFDSDAFSMMNSADKILREPRFIYEMPISELDSSVESDETVTVQGIADCVIFKDGKITVIDYKTDRVSDPQILIDRYSKQLNLYATAMKNTYKLDIDGCYIYSFELNRTIRI